jgi:hypothetical protein
MARANKSVTWTKQDPSRLPDWTAEGVVLTADLERRNLLDELAERVRIRREGGYAGFDVFLFLLYMFASRVGVGLKTFWGRAQPFHTALAALAGRSKLPSPASVSLALDRVNAETMRPVYPWLLLEATGGESVLRHPSVRTRDAIGMPWHVFDFDGTVHALRQRALPERGGLPEARRRCEGFAEPGYAGRKRGDVQVHRATLQHSGSGLWLYAAMAPGNGAHRVDLTGALDVVVSTCARIGHPLERALIRMDGAYGWVPDFTACRERGVPFVTRLTRPELFEQRDVRQRLVDATWMYVPDSGSGPRRSAAELGRVTLHAGADVVRDDGTPYEPIEVRVVVSRFERDKPAQRGRVLEKWQYELFVIDAASDAWPAAETIAAYFGRTAEENRFAQEDKELTLDRIFSYHTPGQEFATIVGLAVWNQRIALGFDFATPPEDVPAQTPRTTFPDLRPVPPETAPPPEPPPAQGARPDEQPVVISVPDPAGARAEILSVLDELDWPTLLASRPGWQWMTGHGELRCPDNQRLTLSFVDLVYAPKGRARVYFTGRTGACDGCPLRNECFNSTKRRAIKMINVTADAARAERLDALLKLLPRQGRMRPRTPPRPKAARSPDRGDIAVQTPTAESKPGLLNVAVSLFLPAAARRSFSDIARGLTTHVHLHGAPSHRSSHPLLAPDERARAHRRLTWEDHLARYALSKSVRVDVVHAGPPVLTTVLGGAAQARRRISVG